MLDPTNLTCADLAQACENNDYPGIEFDFAERVENVHPDLYAAVYKVIYCDDGTFQSDDDRTGNLYISYKPNGTLVADM